jgi:predicted negative regulator of RcsB-dependent stress response
MEVTMPFDAMLVCAGVLSMFAVFAAMLLWGDHQTRPQRQKTLAYSKAIEAVEPDRRFDGLRQRAG